MSVELKVPEAGESISEVEVAEWLKSEGEDVRRDDVVVIIETDKASLEVTAPASGVIKEVLKGPGQSARPGEVIGYIEEGKAAGNETAGEVPAEPGGQTEEKSTQIEDGGGRRQKPRIKLESDKAAGGKPGAGEETSRDDSVPSAAEKEKTAETGEVAGSSSEMESGKLESQAGREEKSVPMSHLRRQIAERLVRAQAVAALLTTFNEIDMSAVMDLRKSYRESFQESHGVKLGFMSFFAKAVIEALKKIPAVNAEIRGTNIVYRNYFDIGIAIGSGKGLVVPVLRNANEMSFAQIERAIDDFGARAQKNALKVEELRGGTFSITNGGIYGSLLSTPIVNPPQSGILGLHVIQERPVVRDGEIVIRPMMYVALTYDHRLVDGKEAVTFLRFVKEMVERPARMLLGI